MRPYFFFKRLEKYKKKLFFYTFIIYNDNHMVSWVYLLSQFTPEALLFEALVICLLLCGYTAFWVIQKRRYGFGNTQLPPGPVQAYLNDLIFQAEQLRIQLFGLLSSADTQTLKNALSLSQNVANSELVKKLSLLESQADEHKSALDAMAIEKLQLSKELIAAKEAIANYSSNATNPAVEDTLAMQNKMKDLESKLEEYNIIEDDLANLKRLQQENLILKSTLAAKGIALPAVGEVSKNQNAMASEALIPSDVSAGVAAAPSVGASPSPIETPAAQVIPIHKPPTSPNVDLASEFEKMLKN